MESKNVNVPKFSFILNNFIDSKNINAFTENYSGKF